MSEPADRWAVNLAGARLLGRYRVERMIGGGGMANVYLARDEQLEIPVVVKVPHAAFLAEAGFRERFDRETRDLVTLQHPHIVRILARGEHEGLPFLVMQFLEGGSLGDRMRKAKGPMPFDGVAPWVRDIGRALDFIHERGIVHRDIKPDNVLFDEYGHAYLSDFGIAKAVGGADTGLTVTGATPGSPAYMAPEQPRTSALTGQSDQYSFAAALYEALSGRPTFEGETVVDVLIQKQSALPLHLAETTPAIPRAAANAIMRSLAKEPEERFESCTALVDAMFAAPGATPTEPTVAAVAASAPPAHDPTAVLPPRPPQAATAAAPPARTMSVGRAHTLSGAMKAVWVVFALLLAVPVALFVMPDGDDSADTSPNTEAPPPAGAKGTGDLPGEYRIDRDAFERIMHEARARRPKGPRAAGTWKDMERALEGGMELTLHADFTFRLVPPARAGKHGDSVHGRWQRMDEVLVLKPDATDAPPAKRGPRVFELRIAEEGRLVFVFGKMGIPLKKQ